MDKASLRKQFLAQRLTIGRSQYWMLTDEIMDQVKLVDWKKYGTVHIFMPIRKHNEIDTFSILTYFKQEHPQIRIVVPRTDFSTLSMANVIYDHEYTILGRNKFDIPEPIHGTVLEPEHIDFIFIPLLAYDLKGNRAGYGKGFYDRFLQQCRPDVRKVGLSFFSPVDEINDVNVFDIPLDACISPGKTWIFSSL